MPVIIDNYNKKDTPNIALHNAIEIISTNNKVLSCLWLLRDFGKADDVVEYHIGFEELLDNLFKEYELKKNELKIDSIYNAYVISLKKDGIMRPHFIVK